MDVVGPPPARARRRGRRRAAPVLVVAPCAALLVVVAPVHASSADLLGGAVVGRATTEADALFHQDEALAGWRLPLRLQPAWFTPVAVREVP